VCDELNVCVCLCVINMDSDPYPPDFIDWMRQVFEQPDDFLHDAVTTAVAQGFSSYNVDWEPSSGVITQTDAENYAVFLGKFADAMHAAGKKLSVDVATWCVCVMCVGVCVMCVCDTVCVCVCDV